MKNSEVLIIGAGPSGMVSALCLAQLGVSSIIVERNSGINEHPKAHELNPRSIEILDSLGISIEELEVEAAPFSDGARILFCKTINEEYGRIDLFDDEARRLKYQRYLKSPKPYLNISQTEIEKILLKHVRQNPLIDIYFEHEWSSLREVKNGIESQILNCKTKEAYTEQSKYVFAADGAGSRCRKFLNIEMEGPDKINDFVSAYFESNLRNHIQHPGKLYWIMNPRSPGTFIAHHIEKRWVYMLPVYLKYQKKEDFTKEFLEERIKTALGDQSLDIKVKSVSFWSMSAQLADTYSKGIAFLVGDAAHRFPPTGGLGMNTGIADAHNISWKVNAVLSGEAGRQLLDTYETERRPIAAQNTEESVFNYHKILDVPESLGLDMNGLEKMAKFQNTAPTKWLPESWKIGILDWITSHMSKKLDQFHTDPVKKEKVLTTIADQVAHFDRIGLDIGYSYENGAVIPDGSPLQIPENKVTDYIPSTRPGARFPHMTLQTTDVALSTHDLFDYKYFTLLISSKQSPWNAAYSQLKSSIKACVQLIVIDELNLTENSNRDLTDLCEIEKSGAILIRPDIHIAWRIKSFDEVGVKKLNQVLSEILYLSN